MSARKVRQDCAHASGSTERRTRCAIRPAPVPMVRARNSLRRISRMASRIVTAIRMLDDLEPAQAGRSTQDQQQDEADGRRREPDDVEGQGVHQRPRQPLGGRHTPRGEHRHPEREIARWWRDGRHQDGAEVVDGRVVDRDSLDVERERERVEDLPDDNDGEQDDRLPPGKCRERSPHGGPVDPPDQLYDDVGNEQRHDQEHDPDQPGPPGAPDLHRRHGSPGPGWPQPSRHHASARSLVDFIEQTSTTEAVNGLARDRV